MIRRRTKRAVLGFLLVAALVLLLFFAVGRYFAAQEERRRYEEERADLRPRPPNVHVVRREARVQTRRYAAELMPWREAQVAAEVSGVVEEVLVERGQRVAKDDVLLRLDSQMSRIVLRAAEARQAENDRLLAEAKALAGRNVAAKTDLAAAEARVAVGRAELDQALETLDRHTIRSPFAGVVNDRYADPGDAVGVNTPVAEVVDLSQLRVVFHVNEFEAGAFDPGVRVTLELQGFGNLECEVSHVTRSADRETRLFRAEAVLPNGDGSLRGGLQGVVQAVVGTFENALFIPGAAVLLSGNRATVQRRTGDDRWEPVEVGIGPETDGMYPVFSGLAEGDVILIR